MDRRTLFLYISLAITLFFINSYFQQSNNESVKEWHQQQKAKRTEQLKDIETQIETETAHASSLPIVKIADQYGIKSGNAVLLNSKEESLPSLQRMTDTTPAVYSSSPDGKLEVANWKHFGSYTLQLVDAESGKVFLANYEDGTVQVLEDERNQIKRLLDGKPEEKSSVIGNAYALLKVNGTYLPMAWYDSKSRSLLSLEQIPAITKKSEEAPTFAAGDEKFYVLENAYFQLVFSNLGGALAEINLPFESSADHESVVHPIEIDREMVQKHPYNAVFPAHAYYTAGNQYHAQGKEGGYYPLIRRDLIESGSRKSVRVPPNFYTTNIISSHYPEVATQTYHVKEFNETSITFESVQSHRKITKTYSIVPKAEGAPYSIDLNVAIEGDSRNLWLTSGVPEMEMISGSPAPALKVRMTRGNKSTVEELSLPTDATSFSDVHPDWISNSNGFFGIIIDPLTEIEGGYRMEYVPGSEVPTRLVEIDQEHDLYQTAKLPGYMTMLPAKSPKRSINYRIFAGPYSSKILKQVDSAFANPETGYTPDYIATQTYHGWFAFISEPFAKLMLYLMNFFHAVTGSWGLSIILLTIALKVMMYPLNAWSAKSMKRMQEVAPLTAKIQEKYKNDPKKAQLEVMNLYREKGANPLSGCFPLLIQMPFLIGMFGLMRSTFELRGASFIPGWIDNLAAPDVLFSWGFYIPFIGTSFHLLPIIMGGTMFLQQLVMSPTPTDTSEMTEQQRQQRAMGTMMPIIFTVLFYHFPSGLNIYFLFSTLLGILQQWWTNKQMEPKKEEAVVLIDPKRGRKR